MLLLLQTHIVQWKVAPESLGRLDWPLPAAAAQAGGTCVAWHRCWDGPLIGDGQGHIWYMSVRPLRLLSCLR